MPQSIWPLSRQSRLVSDRIVLLLATIVLAFCMLLPGKSIAADSQAPLILGIHPYLKPGEIFKRFAPLAAYLTDKLGRPVEVRVGQNYDAHIDAIGNNRIDIAYIGPAVYVSMTKRYGPKPLLARLEVNGKPTFVGYIITRKESDLLKLQDLKSRVFAFGDPQSTMSSLVPRAMMREAGIRKTDLASFNHVRGHENVALQVLAGDADAGAIKEEVFHKYQARGLRALAVTPQIPEHLFITRADLPRAMVDELRKCLLDIRQPELVKKLLKPIKRSISALVSVEDQDYDNLRALMERLDDKD